MGLADGWEIRQAVSNFPVCSVRGRCPPTAGTRVVTGHRPLQMSSAEADATPLQPNDDEQAQ